MNFNFNDNLFGAFEDDIEKEIMNMRKTKDPPSQAASPPIGPVPPPGMKTGNGSGNGQGPAMMPQESEKDKQEYDEQLAMF